MSPIVMHMHGKQKMGNIWQVTSWYQKLYSFTCHFQWCMCKPNLP